MIVFWISVGTICLLTLWMLWLPLSAKSTFKMESIQQRNIAIANERALEIDSALDAGDISAEEHEQARIDLETALADELVTSTELKNQFSYPSKTSTAVILFLIPMFAYGLYSFTSTYDAEAISPSLNISEAGTTIEGALTHLEKVVSTNPQNQQGLYLLAQAYAQLGRYHDSAKRFKQLMDIAEPSADLLVYYADAQAMANGRTFTDELAALIDQALELDSKHISGLWLGGLIEQQLGRPKEALRRWLTLRPLIVSEVGLSQELALLIKDVSDELGPQATKIKTKYDQDTPASDAVTTSELTVSVSLAPALAASANDSDTVFVFARAKTGPPMPLAVSRQTVADLPITVKLNDSMAMLPQMTLSNFEDIVVGARISTTGQAISQPGDMESELVVTKNSTTELIELTISRRKP